MKNLRIQNGFTIVELLIVIVVIGILAAITIVAFNGVQERARIATVTTDLSGAAKLLAVHEVDAGSYPATLASANNGQGVKASEGTTYQYTASGSTYCLTATKGATSYKISNTATAPTAGGCAGHGVGGVAAVTNIITNPSFENNLSIWAVGGDQGNPTATRVAGGPTGNFHLTLSKVAPVGAAQYNYVANNLTPNTTYTLGFWAWADSPGTASVQLARNNIGFSPFITFNSLALTTTPTFYSASGVSPADSSQMRLRITPKTDGTTTHYDGFIVTEGTSMANYADGNSPNWVWNGTTDLSTSTGPPL